MKQAKNDNNSTYSMTHKKIIIAEKPSVAMSYAAALNTQLLRYDGYLEGDEWIVTWAVGHLVTMSYPEKYDEAYKTGILMTCHSFRRDIYMKHFQTQKISSM